MRVADGPVRFGVRWTSDDLRVQVIDNVGDERVVAELYAPTFGNDADLWDLAVTIAHRYEAAAP